MGMFTTTMEKCIHIYIYTYDQQYDLGVSNKNWGLISQFIVYLPVYGHEMMGKKQVLNQCFFQVIMP